MAIKQKPMLPSINQKASIAEYFEYYFPLVPTYSSEMIISKGEQRGLDIIMGGIFLEEQCVSIVIHFPPWQFTVVYWQSFKVWDDLVNYT